MYFLTNIDIGSRKRILEDILIKVLKKRFFKIHKI